MKVRVKFSKQGRMKFIGHLDLMRYFQKAMVRAEIDISYSEGFNPHQKMSFAAPLGVGIYSHGEYMDIELNSATTSQEMLDQLNKEMAPGIEVLSIRKLSDDAKNSMSIVAAADYDVVISEDYVTEEELSSIERFYQSEQIMITKTTKKSQKEVDIRPMIYDLTYYQRKISMKLATGSAMNLKPELVMQAFFQYIGRDVPEYAMQITRNELYAYKADESNELISLEDLGSAII